MLAIIRWPPGRNVWRIGAMIFGAEFMLLTAASAQADDLTHTYDNRLVPIEKPQTILAEHPSWVEPIQEAIHFESPPLINDKNANLAVRAWRFSYNARGIIEIPNHIDGTSTALVVVHPWGIDDGQGWRTPEPAGAADFCTPTKNLLCFKHVAGVLNPMIQYLRSRVRLVMYSGPGGEDPIRKKLYRSIRGQPTAEQRVEGKRELEAKLNRFSYTGSQLPARLTLSKDLPVVDYFRQFPGLDAADRYDPPGFWSLPVPVIRGIDVMPSDILIYDADGYASLRDFLKKQGIRHVLLAGYSTDMCVKGTTAGYVNLQKDFNVFLVGDATLATFPAAKGPACATSAALRLASLDLLITQISWIKPIENRKP
jgi:hypothetical protein